MRVVLLACLMVMVPCADGALARQRAAAPVLLTPDTVNKARLPSGRQNGPDPAVL